MVKTRLKHFAPALLALCTAACSGEPAPPRGVEAGRIVVGTHMALSGPLAGEAAQARDALTLALEGANAAGGVHGREIVLVVEDNRFEAEGGVEAARKLVEQDNVFAVLAPMGAPAVAASLPPVVDSGTLHLFPLVPGEALPAQRGLYDRRMFAPAAVLTRLALTFLMMDEGARSVAILAEDSAYGRAVAEGARTALASRRLVPVLDATFEDRDSAIVALRDAAAAELIVFAGQSTELPAIAEARLRLGLPGRILAGPAAYRPEVAAIGQALTEGVLAVTQFPAPFAGDVRRPLSRWALDFEARFGSPPARRAIEAYTAGLLFVAALEAAGPEPAPDRFVAALGALDPFAPPGFAVAPLDFSDGTGNGGVSGFIAVVRDGRWQRLTGDLQ